MARALVPAATAVLLLAGCAPEYEVLGLVGGDGVLRFNLQFTNELEVDLDLHVLTPLGAEIYWDATEDVTGGQLDVDCLCESCPQGPNENIFWSYEDVAEPGTYEVAVNYWGSCTFDDPPPASDYTLRILEGGAVIETHAGTLQGADDRHATSYTYAQ